MKYRYYFLLHLSMMSWPFLGYTQGQNISNNTQISLLTCGQGEALYEAFGHSAIRVKDPDTGIDYVFNYGMFDFNQPHFYLNFIKGNLIYKLGVNYYKDFIYEYQYFNRSVFEQVLNLTFEEKKKVYAFLLNNSQTENREYSYDYFYDNCATRIRDVFQKVLGESLQFHYPYADTLDYTIRGLTDKYLESSTIYSWGDLGIDIGLGAKIDNQASPYQYMYQPEYLSLAFASATLKHPDGQPVAFAQSIHTLFKSSANPTEEQLFFTPTLVFWLLFLLVFILSLIDVVYHKNSMLPFDILFFFVLGIIGAIITFLWLFTNHTSAENNWNLLWALPTHLIVWLLIPFGKRIAVLKVYFALTAILSLLTLAFWSIIPQDFNEALIPVVLVAIMRSILISSTKVKNFKLKYC